PRRRDATRRRARVCSMRRGALLLLLLGTDRLRLLLADGLRVAALHLDAPHMRLANAGVARHGDGQHAVAERGADVVRLHVLGELEGAAEAAVDAFRLPVCALAARFLALL